MTPFAYFFAWVFAWLATIDGAICVIYGAGTGLPFMFLSLSMLFHLASSNIGREEKPK